VPVKIVTDSAADIPTKIIGELGITVVPAYVNFGDNSYRDGIDISCDELYNKLVNSPIHPSTSQSTPSDFARVYRELSKETDEIVSIHMSAKFSGTYNSALKGKELVDNKCHITVIDTGTITMAEGIIAMSAARLALLNEKLTRILEDIQDSMKNTHLLGTFDTLKYLARGGRIGKGKALLGSVLNVKPVVTIHDGVISPVGNFRTRSKAVDKLFEFVKNASGIQEVAIAHATTPDEAQVLRDRLVPFVDSNHLHIARLGSAIGVHTGPGTLVLVMRNSGGNIESSEISSQPLMKKPLLHLPKLKLPSIR
jgi:DegV family protein with EDD domain